MTATTEPRGGLDYGWNPGEDGWGPNMNANLLRLSRFGFHASVLSMATTAPPGSPASGAGYIIPAGATGAWAGKTGQVAVWDGSAWAYAAPRDGWAIHVVNVGLVVYEDGAWSQSNLATASGVGAEPYAGVPAQTSFWRSTAAGVRAWVQLVAADITDLASTLAAYLTKANPTFTGDITGPGSMVWKSGATSYFSMYGAAVDWALRDLTDGGTIVNYPLVVKRGAAGEIQIGHSGGIRPVRIGGEITNGALAGTGSRPLVATSTGLIDDQDAATFRATIGAMPLLSLTGAVNFNSINSGLPCAVEVDAASVTNAPGGYSGVGAKGFLVQGRAEANRLTQVWTGVYGIAYRVMTSPGVWGAWVYLWDEAFLPAGTTGKAVLAAATQAAARSALGLSAVDLLIHSDFGRSATTDVWQSAFTNNAASGLQLSANSTATGTEITIEQVLTIPADGGASVYQVYIGPQLTGDQSPSGATYVDVIDPEVEYGTGTLRIKIELIGSGSSITGYVTSTFSTTLSGAPFVRTGTITVDGTIANSIDVRFNPDSTTAYIIRRNRVFRRNP